MRAITASDIQMFVLTYDRPAYLELQLNSLVTQTVRPQSITVMDDGDNPQTRNVAKKFEDYGVGYKHVECDNLGGNFRAAVDACSCKYAAIFHDDDQTHPRYIEIAERVLSANPEITLLGCNSYELPPESKIVFDDNVDTKGWMFNARDFATFFLNGPFGHFPFFIYKTENIKRLDVQEYLDYKGLYGKHGDSALVPLAVMDGKAAMLSSKLANYGCHMGQAVSDPKSLPDARCWARVESVFHGLMGDDLRTFAGFSYALRNYKRLKSGYKRRGKHDYSFAEYMRFAADAGAVSPYMRTFRFLSNHYVEKLLGKYYNKMLKKRERVLA